MSTKTCYCSHCGEIIQIPDNLAGTNGFCPSCGQQVLLKSAAAPQPSGQTNDSPKFFLFIDNQQHGPYSEANLYEHLKAGQITPETLVWWEGKQGWEPLSQQTELNLGLTSSLRESGLAPTAVAPERPMAMESPGDGRVDGVAGNTDEQDDLAETGGENTHDNSTTCQTCGKTFKSEKKLLKHQLKKGHGDFDEEDDEEDNEEDNEENSSDLQYLVWDFLKSVGSLALSVFVLIFGFYYLFFAEGCAVKKEMADFKQRLETIVLPAEEDFLDTLATVPRIDHSLLPVEYGEFGGGAMRTIYAAAGDFSDAKRTAFGSWKELYKTDEVLKLFNQYSGPSGQHARDWRVWKDMHFSGGPTKRKLDTEILEKLRVYKREREMVLDELDNTFQEYGLGPLIQ
jgi:DNA-directed RNA polymerase subunit RPC12/RpoP